MTKLWKQPQQLLAPSPSPTMRSGYYNDYGGWYNFRNGTERRNGTTASRSGFYKNMIFYGTEWRTHCDWPERNPNPNPMPNPNPNPNPTLTNPNPKNNHNLCGTTA